MHTYQGKLFCHFNVGKNFAIFSYCKVNVFVRSECMALLNAFVIFSFQTAKLLATQTAKLKSHCRVSLQRKLL